MNTTSIFLKYPFLQKKIFFCILLTFGADKLSANDLSVELVSTDVSCYEGTDGIISAIPSGGMPPYSYQWNNGHTLSTLADVSAGNYILTVSDLLGCSSVVAATIYEPDSLAISFQAQNGICNTMASLSANAFGGVSPYNYSWNNGSTENFLEDIEAGIYSVTISDQNGCVAIDSILIEKDSNQLLVDFDIFPSSCFGADDGAIELHIVEGTQPFTYYINGNVSDGNFENLETGNYTIFVTDANGCSIGTNVFLSEPEAINLQFINFGDGLEVIPYNGFPPYTFEWNNGAAEAQLLNVTADSYSVTVSDQNGCTAEGTMDVLEPLANRSLLNLVEAQLYPNPCTDFCTIDLQFSNLEKGNIHILDLQGHLVEQFEFHGKDFFQKMNIKGYNSGIYFVHIMIGTKSLTKKLLIL